MEYAKDYSLLRPFDLEAAKRGEKICGEDEEYTASILFEYNGAVVIKWSDGDVFTYGFDDSECGTEVLFMAPLAWLEGKPVYKGDVLWHSVGGRCAVIEKSKAHDHDLTIKCDKLSKNSDAQLEYLTWKKPKTKREGWMSCYQSGFNYVYPTKKEADINAMDQGLIACIRIEWEE